MKMPTPERGVTLIELLVSIAVLSLVLAGIYGLLNSAYQTYLNIRRRSESQQTARTVLDYLTYRLREIEGARTVDDPYNCTGCHTPDMSFLAPNYDNVTGRIPCKKDVTIPRRSFALLNLSTVPLPKLDNVPATYQNMSGNYIEFMADLLPIHGFPESFTDDDDDGIWDWEKGGIGDDNANDKYDPGEAELLEDMNENSSYDYFSEKWTLQVRPSADGGSYYELVESLNFGALRPDVAIYNRSPYNDAGYTEEVVAYGIVGLNIKKVPIEPSPPTGMKVEAKCGGGTSASAIYPSGGCHGSNATGGAPNIYDNHSSFSYDRFMETHGWWNVKALSVEVSASSSTVGEEHYVKLKQFVIPRNLEINKYSKAD